MAARETPADLRDVRAADRDDAAELRDDAADHRDDAADQRDTDSADREQEAWQDSDVLGDRVEHVCMQILERLARLEHVTIEAADWPDLTPAAFSHLDTYTVEQRRLAALDRVAVTDLLEQLRHELTHLRAGRHDAARDRHAATRDRHHAAEDRQGSILDRDLAARDRNQAAIERAQADPRDLAADDGPGSFDMPGHHHKARTTHALTASRQPVPGTHGKIARSGTAASSGTVDAPFRTTQI